MSKIQERIGRAHGTLAGFYVISAVLCGLYFNWTYARDNGFVKWLLLGQIIPTAKAVGWPYFVFVKGDHPWAKHEIPQLPLSVRAFFTATDAMVKANEASQGLSQPATAQEINEVASLLREALAASDSITPSELDDLHPGMGTRFIGDQIAGARLALQALDSHDMDAFMKSQGAFVRWNSYWNANGHEIFRKLAAKYNLETR